MTMLLQEFKDFFLENTLRFLWRQWSVLGLLGEARGEDPWVIDPEALLIFTLPIARYEARLFDEVMDWLCVNGKWLDVQRIRSILKEKDGTTHRLLGAILEAPQAGGALDRKWKGLIQYCKGADFKTEGGEESLFKSRDGNDLWIPGSKANEVFREFGFWRGDLEIRNLSREVKPNAKMNLRFLLRGLFGPGTRPECILYLITQEGGHPSEISEAIGASYLATQQMLYELKASGLVLTRSLVGKKVQYWASHKRWWVFLVGPMDDYFKPPIFLNWIALFNGLIGIWEALSELKASQSDYIRSSRLRDAFERVGNEFAKSGLTTPLLLESSAGPEEYERSIQNFILQVFGR